MSNNPRTRALLATGLTLIALAAAPRTASAADSLHPNLWPQGLHSPVLADTDGFVDRLLARMTLPEKVGQMIQADIASITPDELRSYKLGSTLGRRQRGARQQCSLSARKPGYI